MLKDVFLSALSVACCATLAGLTAFDSVPLQAQDADVRDVDIKERLQGVDLTGVNRLKMSPNGELAAGLTVLYEKDSGPESLVKIWSIKKKRLVNEFRIPGKAGEFAFDPDSSIVVVAATTGNLGHTTTIRGWDLAQGAQRKVGYCAGDIRELCFSHDGSRLAAVAALSWLDNPLEMNVVGAFTFEIKVWPVNEKGNALSVAIPHPCGEWVEMWPSKKRIHPLRGEQIEAAFLKVVPKRLRFSLDGKTLICETEAGLRTIYDSRTGVMLQHSGMASVGLFKSMLMIALNQVAADVKSLTISITPREKPILMEQASDGWWRAGKDERFWFKVDGEHIVTHLKGGEKRDPIAMRLGLKDDTNLEELSSFRHPLGVIKISRDEMGMKFRLEEVTDGTESGQTLQTGEVQWGPSVGQQTVVPVPVMNITVEGGSFRGLRFSADGSRIWTNRLESWSVPSGEKLDSAPVAKQKGSFVFDISPAGKRMLIVDQQSGTLIWDQGRPPRERALSKEGTVRFVQFLGKGERFAALLSDPPSVWLGNSESNKDDKVLSLPFEIQRGVFSQSGRLLAFRKARDVVAVWDLELNQHRCLLQHDDSVFSVAISPDGRFVATGASDNVVRLFSTVTGETVARLKGHGKGTIFLASAVYSLAFARNGKYLASGGHDGRVIVWDVESGKAIIEAQVTGQPIVWSVAFSPDSKLVAGGFEAAGAKHGLSVWKLPSGMPRKE